MKTNSPAIMAWDIGGAHIKFAALTADGGITDIRQQPCPMWEPRGEQRLIAALMRICRRNKSDRSTRHAVVMTAESADCFATREEGVRVIISCLSEALGERLSFWTGQGFVQRKYALRHPLAVSSMNWHATASFVASRVPQCLLVDIGSTTTDITACVDGKPLYRGDTDAERLQCGELVYSGVMRTPIMALGASFDDQHVVAERFAETADVYRITNQLPPEADQFISCDGREKTPQASARRLARMFACDYDEADLAKWYLRAHAINRRQCGIVARACGQVAEHAGLQPRTPLVGAGAGRFLAAQAAGLLRFPYKDFADLLNSSEANMGHYATVASTALLLHNA